jgi:hypothetical protein
MASITSPYFSAATDRLSFKVGVNSPPPTLKSVDKRAHLPTVWARDVALLFASTTPLSKYSLHLGHTRASSDVEAVDPISMDVSRDVLVSLFEGTPSSSTSTFKQRTTLKNLRLSPMTMQLPTAGMASFNCSSMRTGGTFSPPAVMMISLIRPVMEINPDGLGMLGS